MFFGQLGVGKIVKTVWVKTVLGKNGPEKRVQLTSSAN